MPYLLDTTTLSFVLKGNEQVIRRLRSALDLGAVYASVVSEGEMVHGEFQLGKERQHEFLDEISLVTGDLTGILPVTREVAHKYGEIFSQLARRGRIIG